VEETEESRRRLVLYNKTIGEARLMAVVCRLTWFAIVRSHAQQMISRYQRPQQQQQQQQEVLLRLLAPSLMTPLVSDDVMSRPSITERLLPAQLDCLTSRVMVNRRALPEVLIRTWFVLTKDRFPIIGVRLALRVDLG